MTAVGPLYLSFFQFVAICKQILMFALIFCYRYTNVEAEQYEENYTTLHESFIHLPHPRSL